MRPHKAARTSPLLHAGWRKRRATRLTSIAPKTGNPVPGPQGQALIRGSRGRGVGPRGSDTGLPVLVALWRNHLHIVVQGSQHLLPPLIGLRAQAVQLRKEFIDSPRPAGAFKQARGAMLLPMLHLLFRQG